MRQIKITDGTSTVTLLRNLEFTISNEVVGTKATMASGKIVMDIVGVRTKLNIPTGYLSKQDVSTLKNMILKSQILKVTYPDTDGDVTGEFVCEPLELKSFAYDDDGVSAWYGVTLKMTGVDVEAYNG